MDEPLGLAVGNALEVREAIDALSGERPGELMELCDTLGACILTAAGVAENDEAAKAMLERAVADGSAKDMLAKFVAAQGGDPAPVYDPGLLPTAPVQIEVPSEQKGYVNHIDAGGVGMVSMHLGGGRATKESEIDLRVGVILHKKVGDSIEVGESIAQIHAADEAAAAKAAEALKACYTITEEKPERKPFIKGIVR